MYNIFWERGRKKKLMSVISRSLPKKKKLFHIVSVILLLLWTTDYVSIAAVTCV